MADEKKTEKPEAPAWSVKKQKAYKINRLLMKVQIGVALLLALLIWFGTRYALR